MPRTDTTPSPRDRRARPPAHALAAPVLDPAGILASIGAVPYAWRIDTDVLHWGDNVAEVLKIADPAAVATGRSYARLLDGSNAQTRHDAVCGAGVADAGAGVPYRVEYRLVVPPDGELWIEDIGRWFAGEDGRPARAHGVVRVIEQQRLVSLLRVDGLTGEMNRWHLSEVLTSALDEVVRYRSSCGLLIVAIDNLARLNEAYGFDIADQVIAAVGKRLRTTLRGGDALGRLSGSKFGVLLKTCTPEELPAAAERLLSGVREEVVQTSGGSIAVTITIGGVNAPRHARSVHEMFARAQDALDLARMKRRGSFYAYRPNAEREAVRRKNVRPSDEIVAALNQRHVLIAFEPVVEASTREPAFYECLMRVRRPDGTSIRAADAIPMAERLGLVRLLDHRVLQLVVDELVVAPALNASVNVSPDSISDPDWWAGLSGLLRAHSGVAERLTIEITESAAIQDIEDARGLVTRVKDLGCLIAVDDFGASYTSFRNLRRLGVDMIKIDGAFVQDLARSPDDRAFVRMLIDLARRLGLATVAEWVQDENAAAMLAEWGCDYLQGALIGLASLQRPWAADSPVQGVAPRT